MQHLYVWSDGSHPLLPADTFEMVSEDEDGKVMFKVNYHYMSQVKNANDTNSAARSRRLAQEAVTLSTSLPLSSSSSVFVRCDEERLDIMKVAKGFLTVRRTQVDLVGLDCVVLVLVKTRSVFCPSGSDHGSGRHSVRQRLL